MWNFCSLNVGPLKTSSHGGTSFLETTIIFDFMDAWRPLSCSGRRGEGSTTLESPGGKGDRSGDDRGEWQCTHLGETLRSVGVRLAKHTSPVQRVGFVHELATCPHQFLLVVPLLVGSVFFILRNQDREPCNVIDRRMPRCPGRATVMESCKPGTHSTSRTTPNARHHMDMHYVGLLRVSISLYASPFGLPFFEVQICLVEIASDVCFKSQCNRWQSVSRRFTAELWEWGKISLLLLHEIVSAAFWRNRNMTVLVIMRLNRVKGDNFRAEETHELIECVQTQGVRLENDLHARTHLKVNLLGRARTSRFLCTN